jgi:hypothetical protein
VEERKIEDQARQRRAVAVYGYLLLLGVSGIVAFPLECKGLEEVSTCVCDQLNGTSIQVREYNCTALRIGMHKYVTSFTLALYMSTTHTHTP